MNVFHDINHLNLTNPVVTTGVFDGVHEGHKEIIKTIVDISRSVKGESVIVTYWPHPRLILNKRKTKIELLNTLEEKMELLEKSGIDNVVVIPFTKSFSELSYREFVGEILCKKLKTKHLVTGFNHHFGKNREGNFDKLMELSNELNFKIYKLDPYLINNERVSSTIIRESLKSGKLDVAREYLGYDYFFTGHVIEGNKLGRRIGFPTANIEIYNELKLLPKEGVYSVLVNYNHYTFEGMMNIGFRPTLEESAPLKTIEVHLFDIDLNLYKEKLKIQCIDRVRDEKKFNNLDELKTQLKKDKHTVFQFFKNTHAKLR